jgi:ABC-2 type transport system permease protein
MSPPALATLPPGASAIDCRPRVTPAAVGNVERLRVYVRSGLFDALLVRPLSSLIQLVVIDVAATW